MNLDLTEATEREKQCPCGKIFRYTPTILGGVERFAPPICDECVALSEQQSEHQRAEMAANRRESDWGTICPPLYQSTDIERLPAHYRRAIETWSYSHIAPAFIGPAGHGKTRAAFEILKRQHFAGVKVCAISSTRFARVAADQFDQDHKVRGESREILSRLLRARLILIDDLGKQRMTDRAEVELFDLLEHRTSNMLPTIWTANATGDDLLAMFSVDRGEPLLRRLAEFSEPVTKAKYSSVGRP